MIFRFFTITALSLSILAAATPIALASDVCEAEVATLQDALASAAYDLTPSVALALQDAVISCSASTAANRGLPADLLGIKVQTEQRPARECGFVDPTQTATSAAPITVTYQVTGPFVGDNRRESDAGPALGTYQPASNFTTYSVKGQKWGLDAFSPQPDKAGHAMIYLYGIPIPTTAVFQHVGTGGGMARAGCTDTASSLCWASGEGYVQLLSTIWVKVESTFAQC